MERNFYAVMQDSDNVYHIGKKKDGWAFVFQAGASVPWFNFSDLENFLIENDLVIEDENHKQYSLDEFWNVEVGESKFPHEGYWDIESYYRAHPEEDNIDWSANANQIADGVCWDANDFE